MGLSGNLYFVFGPNKLDFGLVEIKDLRDRKVRKKLSLVTDSM